MATDRQTGHNSRTIASRFLHHYVAEAWYKGYLGHVVDVGV